MSVERTHRWRVAFVFVLFTSTAGLYLGRPSVFLASILGVAYAGYPLLVGPPTVDLDLSRTVTDGTPDHGDPVTVTVTVTNTGPRTLADLRIVDGVPALLTVVDGTPRHAATLRPGASTTFRYTVAARHGSHQFDPATVIAHDVSTSTRVETEVEAGGRTTVREELACPVDLRGFRLRREARRHPGRSPADAGGSGLEFHRTRAYRGGDPMNRIDWNRYARTGDLTTVEFREDHRPAVVLCLDARPAAVRAASSSDPHAVAYCVAAAREVLSTLEGRDERVGVAVFDTGFDWHPPAAGRQQYARIERLLGDREYGHPAPASIPDSDRTRVEGGDPTLSASGRVEQLLARTSGTVEVVAFSPLVDGFGEAAARRLDAHGHAVTVVSPDVTTDRTVGGAFVRIERANRVRSLRNRGVPVADWSPGTPLVWPVDGDGGVH